MSIKRRDLLLIAAGLCGTGVAVFAKSKSTNTPKVEVVQGNTSVPTTARIVVISDLNSQYGSTTYEAEVDQGIALIQQWRPDLVLCSGDMIAGQKASLSKSQIEAMWEAFDRHIAQPLRNSNIPLGFTIGNHDGSGTTSNGELVYQKERDLASIYWQTQDLKLNFVDQGEFPFYYTFQQQEVFYLVWDASTSNISATQLAWVEQSLASTTAQQAKMRVVIGHLPLYAVAIGRNKVGEVLEDRENLRLLLEKYHVHTYISGHHHAYYPGQRGKLQLLHAGALGAGPRKLLNTTLPPRKTITIIEINLNQVTTNYITYDLKDMKVVDVQSLPRIITSPFGGIWRRDIQWQQLTPEEKQVVDYEQ